MRMQACVREEMGKRDKTKWDIERAGKTNGKTSWRTLTLVCDKN